MSRVLSWTIIYLLAPLPTPSSSQPERSAGHTMALLFAIAPEGLAKPPYRYDAGSLLHYRFSFSLTRLREQRESSFLRRFPSGHPARPLACLLPCGARTFLMTLARPAIVWPTSHTRLYQTAMMWGRIGTMFANKT